MNLVWAVGEWKKKELVKFLDLYELRLIQVKLVILQR